ncbi:MAG: cupin domain-containing protein [Oscillospiraceae bacterium]|nr:cupin domain-containing protein [Oscillospiraceae bacterium]
MAAVEKGQVWVFESDVPGTSPGEGVTRKILAYCDEAMCVAHHFEKGAIGSVHTHPHTQITYVAEGEFEFEVDGVKKVVKKGDTLLKQDGVPHGAVCLEKGTLIDFFTPMRADFL